MTLYQSAQIMQETNVFLGILAIAFLAFGIWAFIDMLNTNKRKLSKTQKGLWSIAFLTFLPLTSIVWAIVRK